MTRPTKLGSTFKLVGGALGYDPDADIGDFVPPVDRAADDNGAYAVTVNTPSTGGIVQTKVGAWSTTGAGFSVSFDATPTNGNTMIGVLWCGESTGTIDTSGWSALVTGAATSSQDHVAIWTKVAGASEPTAVHVAADVGGKMRKLVLYEVAGSVDVSGQLSNQPRTSPLVGPTLTPGDPTGVLIAAFIGRVATYTGDPTMTPVAPLETDAFERQSPGRTVAWVGHQDTTTGSYTPTLATTALYSGTTTGSVAVIVGATPTDPAWNVPAPKTIDSDDATYHEIDGPDVLRVELDAAYLIVSARLLIGSQNAGAVTYNLQGANEADFSDAVSLDSATYAATGSYTADDVDFVWTTTVAYQYYQLTGTDENRYVYSFELYEADDSAGQDHSHDDLQSQIDDLADAIDSQGASSVSVLDTGGFFTGTDVEAVLAETGEEVEDLQHRQVTALTPVATITATKDSGNPTFNFDAIPESVVKVGDTYYCVYQTWATATDVVALATATDRDGPWTAYGTIYNFSDVSWAPAGANAIYAPHLMEDDGTFYLFYSVCDETDGSDGHIGYATATTVTGPYTDHGSAILSPTAAAWDALRVGEPSVIHHDGRWVMAYLGETGTFGLGEKVGIATASTPGGTWTKAAGNPLIDWGSSGAWDDTLTADPSIFFENGYYWVWYSGGGNGDGSGTRPWSSGLAYALDPTGTWTKHADNPILSNGGVGTWEEKAAWRGSIYIEDGLIGGVYGGLVSGLATAKGGNFRLTVDVSSIGAGTTSPLTTKGDLWTYSTTDARLAVGSNGTGVYADSSETLGIRWTVQAITGELLMADGVTAPPVPVETEAQDDWLYADL